jgi:predicted negative regulator of RcsB-dependent stress response
MRPVITVFIALFFFAFSAAQASEALKQTFASGNEAYQTGDFDAAIEAYSTLVGAGIDNPVLHYNLGNAYFKSGQLGMAIASYSRALRLDPRNDDVKANLEFAKQYMADKVDPTAISPIWAWYRSLALNYTANEWSVLASVLLISLSVVVGYMVWTRNNAAAFKAAAIVLASVLVVVATCAGVNIRLNYFSPRASIVVPEVSVKAGPGEDTGEQFVAHEGLTFNVLKQESGWYLGVFDNRLKGWIKVSDAVKI